MFFYISKLLQPLLWPLNIALLFLLVMMVCFLIRRDRLAKISGLCALVLLWFTGLPVLSVKLIGYLESQYPPLLAVDAPVSDAIVVLGGTVLGVQPPRKEVEEAFGSRVLGAARLYRAGKAPLVVVSSGVPYQLPSGEYRTDAYDMGVLLGELGVPRANVVLDEQGRNTYESAVYTKQILDVRKIRSILLVTTAYHMPRAVALFKQAGIADVRPFPVEVRVTHAETTWRDFLPELGAIGMNTAAIKEIVGTVLHP